MIVFEGDNELTFVFFISMRTVAHTDNI